MNKKTAYFLKISIILFLLTAVFSCGNEYTKNKTILEAEQLLTNYPDSAYNLLLSIKQPENLSETDYAAWCLHFTHAQYKLYIDIKSDSLIKKAIKFYDNTNLNYCTGTAYYLLGCISELNGEDKDAMISFKKGEDILTKNKNADSLSSKIKALIYYRISNLFLSDEFNNESYKYITKAINLFEKLKDYRFLAYSHRIKVEILYRQEKPISEILNEAEICQFYALKSSNGDLYNNMLAFRGKILISKNLYEAKKNLLLANKSSNNSQQELLSLLTYVYAKLNLSDSAKYYQKFLSIKKNDFDRLLISKLSNSYIYLNENNNDSAFTCFENAYNLREQIYKENIKKQLIRIDKQYDLSKKEAEKARLEIQNQKNVILIAFLSITILAVLIILLFITNINKKHQANFILEKQQLEFEVKAKQLENEKRIKILLANLQNKIDNTLHFKQLQNKYAKQERKDEFINEITRQSILTDKEWQFYIDEANSMFNNNIYKLKEEYKQLTNSDLIVIAFICLGIDIPNSIILLDYSNINSLYLRRNRIRKHLGLDTTVDLDKWLINKIVVDSI